MNFDSVKCTESGHKALDAWNGLINEIAPGYGVPPNLCKAHILYESGGNEHAVGTIEPFGYGLGQITSGVEVVDGVPYWLGSKSYPIMSPFTNITVMCKRFIKPNLDAFPNSIDAVIAAYNAGIGAVSAALAKGTPLTEVTYGAWYVPAVSGAYAWLNATSHRVIGR